MPEESRPAILGHRGALMLAPENTLTAFEFCLLGGVDIELDVYPTRDGQLVVIHDPSVNRTTDGTGRVSDLTWAEVEKLDAGSWFHPDFSGERIPSLEQVFQLVKQRERHPVTVAVNLKPINKAVLEGVPGLIRKYDLFAQSFLFDMSLEVAAQLKKIEPRLRCAASVHNYPKILDAVQNPIIDVIWTGTRDPEAIKVAHAHGKQIFVTLVNNANEWLKLKELGVDGIVTNFPLRMKRAAWPPPSERDWDNYLTPEQRMHYRYIPIQP